MFRYVFFCFSTLSVGSRNCPPVCRHEAVLRPAMTCPIETKYDVACFPFSPSAPVARAAAAVRDEERDGREPGPAGDLRDVTQHQRLRVWGLRLQSHELQVVHSQAELLAQNRHSVRTAQTSLLLRMLLLLSALFTKWVFCCGGCCQLFFFPN